MCTAHQLVVCPPYLKDLTAQFQLKPTYDGYVLFACVGGEELLLRSSRPVEGTVYILKLKSNKNRPSFSYVPSTRSICCVAFSILYGEADTSN